MRNIKIIIADLNLKFEQLQKKDPDKVFYTKLADYGKYLLDNKEVKEALAPLYKEAQKDIAEYIKVADLFLHKWNNLAKDLIRKAEKAGIKDDLNNPSGRPITDIKQLLGQKKASGYSKDIDLYYRAYDSLIKRFMKEKKQKLIIPKHIDRQFNHMHLQVLYNQATTAWNKFKRNREIKTWWAHYQIERLTYGVYQIKDKNTYFHADNIVDQMYYSEFCQVLSGNDATFVILNRNKFSLWLEVLHKYVIPRLEALEQTDNYIGEQLPPRLQYFPQENIALFKTMQYQFIGKGKALLIFLNENKGTPFTFNEIKENCNSMLIESKKFKNQKELSDTLRHIKKCLKVNNREYFPIQKQGDSIIWINK